jgi:hypothetical protein
LYSPELRGVDGEAAVAQQHTLGVRGDLHRRALASEIVDHVPDVVDVRRCGAVRPAHLAGNFWFSGTALVEVVRACRECADEVADASRVSAGFDTPSRAFRKDFRSPSLGLHVDAARAL